MKFTWKQFWADLVKLEYTLVALLNAWAIVADLLIKMGTPTLVVTDAAALLTLVGLVVQKAITADKDGGVEAFLVAIVAAWSVVASCLSTLGVPIKIVTVAGAALALVALILQRSIVASFQRVHPIR